MGWLKQGWEILESGKMSLCFKCFFLEFHNVLKTYCKLFLIQNIIFYLKIDWAFFGGGKGFKFWGGGFFCCFVLC